MLELRKQVEKQSNDLGNATRTITDLRTKVIIHVSTLHAYITGVRLRRITLETSNAGI